MPRELGRPLEITPCAWTLEPPALDLAARERTRETVDDLDTDDPMALELAERVAYAELAAANWEGLADPDVHTRVRETLTWFAPIVDRSSTQRERGLLALVCMHGVLGDVEETNMRLQQLLSAGYDGHSYARVSVVWSEFLTDQDVKIQLLSRAVEADPLNRYASYRLAWALRHPQAVDLHRAVAVLERLREDLRREPILNAPQLERALAYRVAIELRALGRDVSVPPLDCQEN